MIITKLSEQQKNPDRVNVFIDNKYTLSLTLQQVLDEKIKVGKQVDKLAIERLEKLSKDGKVKARTLEWLHLRPHSEKELRDYLHKKGVTGLQSDTWIGDFQKYGYQNDETFAIWWLEQRRRKNRSDTFIRYELRSKGISENIIQAVISKSNEDDIQTLKRLIAKKRQQSRYADTKKLKEYLMRQGYRYSDIVEALAE